MGQRLVAAPHQAWLQNSRAQGIGRGVRHLGEIRRLNRLYRRKDYSTDILSFQGAEDSTVGELVLCMPILRRQAKRTGLGETGELGYMLVHGTLHLLGFDHEEGCVEGEMFTLQDELYARLQKSVGLR